MDAGVLCAAEFRFGVGVVEGVADLSSAVGADAGRVGQGPGAGVCGDAGGAEVLHESRVEARADAGRQVQP